MLTNSYELLEMGRVTGNNIDWVLMAAWITMRIREFL